MAHAYPGVLFFSIIYLVGFGFFFVLLEMEFEMFSCRDSQTSGIKSPHINQIFLDSSDTKHKAG